MSILNVMECRLDLAYVQNRRQSRGKREHVGTQTVDIVVTSSRHYLDVPLGLC